MPKVQVTPQRPVYPSPAALITSAAADGTPNVVTLGECFNVSIFRPVIMGIAIRTATYSHGFIRERGEFVINLPTAALVRKVDAVGMVSGRECDKFETIGLTPLPAREVAPPLIAECPVNIECRVLSEQEVGDHQLFLGQVLVQHVDEDKLREDGRPDPERVDMLIFAENTYFSAGPMLGRMGLSRR
jgi:flavin reductase (DIM6/NTAB) family NADH-FMN oxidoreductase RutF